MPSNKKLLQAAAGSAGGDPLYAEDVFSTYLYDGTGAARTIANGIALSDEGGLVWIKSRSNADSSYLFDTVNGPEETLSSNATTAGANYSAYWDFPSAGTTGFNLKAAPGNYLGWTMASWTFRKAEKFFDVVTWTGNSTAGRTVAHNLGSAPKFVIVKRTDTANNWICWHSGIAITKYLQLNSTSPAYNDGGIFWDSTLPDASNITLGADSGVNATGSTYVAYLFASDAGGFGDDGDENIIKCGSYVGDGGAGTTEVNLGFEPQWILVKASSAADNWFVIDNMRGWATESNTSNDAYLMPNNNNAESTGGFLDITSTGFKTTLYSNVNVSGRTYIYVAIRRPMKTPESGTEVFSPNATTTLPATMTTGFPVDLTMTRTIEAVNYFFTGDRLRGNTQYLSTATTNAEAAFGAGNKWLLDSNTTITQQNSAGGVINYNFKRATGFMDVVAYTGTGALRTVTHGLKVIPELIICKSRSASWDWAVYTATTGGGYYLRLNRTEGSAASSSGVFPSAPTDSVFSVGTASYTNQSGGSYISYLFATVAGVSKVGSYTGTGSAVNVDCGFSAGARFILIKRSDSTGDWYVWDSVRGITVGNDPYLLLNSTAEGPFNTDYVDPLSSGFTVTSSAPAALNASGGTYIFLAIA